MRNRLTSFTISISLNVNLSNQSTFNIRPLWCFLLSCNESQYKDQNNLQELNIVDVNKTAIQNNNSWQKYYL